MTNKQSNYGKKNSFKEFQMVGKNMLFQQYQLQNSYVKDVQELFKSEKKNKNCKNLGQPNCQI